MQVTLEKTGDLEGRVKVEVTQNDYLDKVNKELKEIGRNPRVPQRSCKHRPAPPPFRERSQEPRSQRRGLPLRNRIYP